MNKNTKYVMIVMFNRRTLRLQQRSMDKWVGGAASWGGSDTMSGITVHTQFVRNQNYSCRR